MHHITWTLPSSCKFGCWSTSCAHLSFMHAHTHGESTMELCHHHGISQKNPLEILIYSCACVSSVQVLEYVYFSFPLVESSVASNGTPTITQRECTFRIFISYLITAITIQLAFIFSCTNERAPCRLAADLP